MTWATHAAAGPSTSWSAIPSTAAPVADGASTPPWTTSPSPSATTPTASSTPRSAWWSRTACRTARPVGICGGTIGSSSLGPRSRTGSRPPEKKSQACLEADYLDRALQNFSGYLAIDELYDGPFCVLSLVDNRTFTRLTYRVLEHDPTHDDIRLFLRDFRAHLQARALHVQGITTDGSNLYAVPLAELFPGIPHQVCAFHVLKELTQAVLHALAKIRKELKAQIPKRPRGRPSKAQAQAARRAQRLEQRVSNLFEHRYLFVRKELTSAEAKTLQRITRGLPHLRTLRDIMDEVYRLFDRRCRAATALARLAKLRARVRRFRWLGRALDKLQTPNLEKALTFLDDKLLPATSNAVERSNRRFRKAQRSVYSVRTAAHIRQRIALDMQREQQASARRRTTTVLHHKRIRSG
jgi:Transposase